MAGFDLLFAAMPLMCFLSGCAWIWLSAADVFLERVLAISSFYIGSDWFDLLLAAMQLMCFFA